MPTSTNRSSAATNKNFSLGRFIPPCAFAHAADCGPRPGILPKRSHCLGKQPLTNGVGCLSCGAMWLVVGRNGEYAPDRFLRTSPRRQAAAGVAEAAARV